MSQSPHYPSPSSAAAQRLSQPNISSNQPYLAQYFATPTALRQPYAFPAPLTAQSVHTPQPAIANLQPQTAAVASVTSANAITTTPIVSHSSSTSDNTAVNTPSHSATSHSATQAAAEAATYAATEAERVHYASYGDEHELSDADFIDNGEWQSFTTSQHDNNENDSTQHSTSHTKTTIGVSAHILQQMTAPSQQAPQQRYTATQDEVGVRRKEEEVRRKEAVAGVTGVDVGLLDFGSEWDASGRVWDWVVRERQREEETESQPSLSEKEMDMMLASSATANMDDTDAMLKEFYL